MAWRCALCCFADADAGADVRQHSIAQHSATQHSTVQHFWLVYNATVSGGGGLRMNYS